MPILNMLVDLLYDWFRRAPEPLGYRGMEEAQICAQLVQNTDAEMWMRERVLCRHMIERAFDSRLAVMEMIVFAMSVTIFILPCLRALALAPLRCAALVHKRLVYQ